MCHSGGEWRSVFGGGRPRFKTENRKPKTNKPKPKPKPKPKNLNIKTENLKPKTNKPKPKPKNLNINTEHMPSLKKGGEVKSNEY